MNFLFFLMSSVYQLFCLLSSVDKPTKETKVKFVNVDLTSMQHNNDDDAYDFNTDFV